MQRMGMGYVSRWRQIQARLNFGRCKPVPTWTFRHSSDNSKEKNDKLSKKNWDQNLPGSRHSSRDCFAGKLLPAGQAEGTQ